MEELTEKIDRYLRGEMEEAELAQFEQEIQKDDVLSKEVNLQRKTVYLLEEAARAELKSKVMELNHRPTKMVVLKPYLRIAAILILLLGSSYFLVRQRYTDTQLYSEYFEPYPDRLTVMGGSSDLLMKAMGQYNQQNFSKANQLFEEIIEKDGSQQGKVYLYQAICYTQVGEATSAIELLKMIKSNDEEYNPALEWQMILSHLANDNGAEAEKLLREFITQNDGYQQTKAEKLLEDLESIWR